MYTYANAGKICDATVKWCRNFYIAVHPIFHSYTFLCLTVRNLQCRRECQPFLLSIRQVVRLAQHI